MAPLHPLPNVQLSYGPMLIDVFANMILYGVLVGQMLTYHEGCRKDPKWLRLFVLFLLVIETANTVLDMVMIYQPLILEYGQKPVFFPTVFMARKIILYDPDSSIYLLPPEPLSVVLVSMPVQIFFGWRIYQLTACLWIPFVVFVFAMASFAGGLWTSIRICILKHIADKILLHNSKLLWLLSACGADIIITVSLVITLRGKKTGLPDADTIVDKVIRATIQTGMITYVSAFLPPTQRDAINFTWDIALSKLYTNCLMSTLNARQAFHLPRHMLSFTTVPIPGPGMSGKRVMIVQSAFECAPGPLESNTDEGSTRAANIYSM
ncbi:hypothetical protein DFH07DRAFT_963603 [Mycena maculata]|uniref:DUF6534 domain-containing protein n=1 Tax=Mycena maculata TaxID=230809 RepID=A0AAD7N3G3_9AGAR|nr:hypothetical protein DFH07DRAFT_963603 [Mycena maculata]